MRKRNLLLGPLVGLLALAGCGGSSTSVEHTQVPAPFVCQHKVPAQAGECIRQELAARSIQPAAPKLSTKLGASRAQCVDISVYQGVPDFRAGGVRCAIVQTNDGSFRNRLFYAQTQRLRQQHISFGFYTFVEAFSGASQAATSVSMGQGQGGTLGYWADTEVSGSYEQACSYVNYAKSHGAPIVGVYASPGNYFGGRCQGYIWPAEWGSGGAYPLSGYSYSAIKIRQWCGTCYLSGFSGQVDRDENLGLIELVKPPPPPCTGACLRKRHTRELRVHEHLLIDLRARQHTLRRVLVTYGCRRRKHAHEKLGPRCTRWFVEGSNSGKRIPVEEGIIHRFHIKGIV